MDEDSTTRLLRLASPRPHVAAERAERVRRAVHLEWQSAARQRAVRRRTIAATALLAAAAAFVVTFRVSGPRETAVPVTAGAVATIERLDGPIGLSANDRVRPGDWLDTGATGRVAVRLTDGTSVRLDTGSRARFLTASIVELAAGAIYVDTSASSRGLEVRTPLGTARDLGTQFEVRLRDQSLHVRVRTGAVELRYAGGAAPARAGTELILTGAEATSRALDPAAPEWAWAAGIAPSFPIEGRRLAAFLEHLAREQGWTLHYADPALAGRASGIVLHGSIDGLRPTDQLAVALASSGLAHRLEDGQLTVFRP
jgi:ferric-dicitrate binding protein FerR (iron transport regulator)